MLKNIFKEKGFTLLELMLIIVLTAILGTILLISSKPEKRIGESNDQRRSLDTQAIEQAIKVVALDTGSVPQILKDLTEDVPYAIVKAGGNTTGTYTCPVLSTDLSKTDISSAISSVITTMPIDPDLASDSNDTGYYIQRTGSLYKVEPCSTYKLAATSGNKQMCGDGYCHINESCSTCPQDCGDCQFESYTVGPIYAGSGTDSNSGYVIWNTPENILADDSTYAQPAVSYLGEPCDSGVRLIKTDGSYSSENKKTPCVFGTFGGVISYGDSSSLWGETWTPSDINNSNFGLAYSSIGWDGVGHTNYLKATNFNFNIPSTATITGIKAEVDKSLYCTGKTCGAVYIRVDFIRITVYYND